MMAAPSSSFELDLSGEPQGGAWAWELAGEVSDSQLLVGDRGADRRKPWPVTASFASVCAAVVVLRPRVERAMWFRKA